MQITQVHAFNLALLSTALSACRTPAPPHPVSALQPPATNRSRVASSYSLPPLDGGRLKVSVVEVVYGPGGASGPHSHPCPVTGHVLEGAVRMQVKGEPETVFRAGESFYEAPNEAHLVSANASTTEPAKFLAYFVCEGDLPLSVPVPHSGTPEGGSHGQ